MAVALRQAASSPGNGSVTVTLGAAPLGGSLCIVASACRSKTGISMSRAGWSVVGGPLSIATDAVQFMWRVAVAGDPAAIVVSYDDVPDVSLIAAEFTGSWGPNPVNVVGTAIGTGAPFRTHKALTPAANKSALFVTAGVLNAAGAPPMFPDGITNTVVPFPHMPVNGHPSLGLGYQVIPLTVAAAYDPFWTNATGDDWAAYSAVFTEFFAGTFAGEPGGGVW